MPLFEYVCSECGTEFEELVSSGAKSKKVACPECGSKSTEKKLSAFCVGKASSGAGASSCATGTCPFG